MRSFLAALQFLTIFPLPRRVVRCVINFNESQRTSAMGASPPSALTSFAEHPPSVGDGLPHTPLCTVDNLLHSAVELRQEQVCGSALYFPWVGLLLGLILSAVNLLLGRLWPFPLFVNAALVVLLAVLTGGLHLDGLADTFDVFCVGSDREDLLRIMRDPHIGAMGVLSLVGILLLKFSLFCSLGPAKSTALILMCVLSRWSLVAGISLFPYARKEGKAGAFFGNMDKRQFAFVSLAVFLSAVFLGRGRGVLGFSLVFLFTYVFNRLMQRRIGGITGDTLGAACELNEVLFLAIWLIT